MFPNKCTLMPQCPSVNAQKEKKTKQNPERYQIICLTDKEAHLCLFSLCNAIALIAFPYLGHKQRQSPKTSDCREEGQQMK